MKSNMLKRSTLREIKATLGRFFAILAIVALGVGFFSGVRITTPVMVNTVNDFIQEKNLYDYRLISTLGWEESDVDFFRQTDGVRYAEGANSIDILCAGGDDEEFVIKAHSMPENINLFNLKEGRMPENDSECLIDNRTSFSPGDKITLSAENEPDTFDALKYKEFTIVGKADSVYYVNFERGTTSIGNGSISGFMYVMPEAFERDYYSEIFVKLNNNDLIYSKEYKDFIKNNNNKWENLTAEQAQERYEKILAEAREELNDGKKELEEKRTDGMRELSEAKEKLDDGKEELENAERELADSKKRLDDAEKELDTSEKKLADSKAQLDGAQKKLADSKRQLDSAKAEIDRNEKLLAESEKELTNSQKQLDDALAEIEKGSALLSEKEEELTAQKEEISEKMQYFEGLTEEQRGQLLQAKEQLEQAEAELTAQREILEKSRQETAENQKLLESKKNELIAGKQALQAGKAQYESGLWQYNSGLAEYNSGKKAYDDGLKKYNDGLAEYQEGIVKYNDGKKEFDDAQKEYDDGLADYRDGQREFDEKIADAEREISEAEKEIADIEKPETYVLDRNTNIGYACFESDSEIVEQVARVFPVFFILVAVLVCMTTMSRMVEEQRTQIGVLKALGYSDGAIMGKFLFYSGSASLTGCIIGYAVGVILFPSVIWLSYELMYIKLPLRYIIDWKLAVLAIAVSLVCSMGTTWAVCRLELSETSADLMRPKAPKAGKRVFLEYVPFIWNRLKFLHKTSIRNIFRYKGRFFMMIIGISGCTALLVTGFGLKDSVAGFAEVQYGEIQVADASLTLKADSDNALPESLKEKMDTLSDGYILMNQSSWDLVTEEKVKSISVIAPFDSTDMNDFMRLHTNDGTETAFPEKNHALVSNSISERYGVKTGDTITLRNEDMHEMHITVSGVFENHVYNYVILSAETMENQLGEMPELNSAYVNFRDGDDIYKVSAELSKDENITNIQIFEEMKNRLSKMMSSLDYIVLLVIICAGLLAFIVLYNLTNINITERTREIATIKVLGFFRKETSAYVLRENIALTAMGITAGLGLGILLHRFVVSQIIVDIVSFKIRILPVSFLYSVILTFVFNIIVNAFMGIKLEKINMAESLKSVD